MEKECKKCGLIKNVNDFYKGQAQCKRCKIKYQKELSLQNKNKIKEYKKAYHVKNIESIKEKKKNNYESNKDYVKEKSKIYYALNRDKKLEYQKEYAKNHKVERNKNTNRRLKEDNLFRLRCAISKMLNSIFRRIGLYKESRSENIIGCSIPELKSYFESKFDMWMNWNNYGKYNGELNHGWDIDHIIPVSTAKTEEDIIKLNHYSNLQPLCSKINRDIKKDKIQTKWIFSNIY